MPTDQEQPATPPQEEPVQSGLIDFAEPAAELDPTKVAAIQTVEETAQERVQSHPEPVAVVEDRPKDRPEPVNPAPSLAELADLQRQAGNDDMKRDFTLKVLEARKPPPPDAEPPALAPRIVEQTNAELEAGRKLVAKNEELAALRRPHAPDKSEGTSTSVYRPEDYVPNQKKGQGHVQARNL